MSNVRRQPRPTTSIGGRCVASASAILSVAKKLPSVKYEILLTSPSLPLSLFLSLSLSLSLSLPLSLCLVFGYITPCFTRSSLLVTAEVLISSRLSRARGPIGRGLILPPQTPILIFVISTLRSLSQRRQKARFGDYSKLAP